MNDTTVTNAINFNMNHGQAMAKPLCMQRLEASLNIEPFMAYAQEMLAQPLTSSEDSDSDVNTDILAPDEKIMNGIVTSKCGNFYLSLFIKHQFKAINKVFVLLFRSPKWQTSNLQSITNRPRSKVVARHFAEWYRIGARSIRWRWIYTWYATWAC